ncbi:TetR/AcrR family transcriptional regulator [Fusibacter ferrireducens]|uniref:TetR/AcrR family transcriptional regulator n=1 Tax=Fusibacter ferrireducens TaxID=2785058 RepID=A0ABR9ZR95_9FIRM|nr:TetR/AcrR family transcriptional regulator [Fusibacter ferrireducens]MBF4692164.1 TetR/AcrR family transcriptional regulator [Fusibacter ferrireducens]
MINKGNRTRQFIIENAISVFSKKGYTAVTMKDICESCQMSRGGVYGHFSSTKEIFIAILDNDLKLNRAIVEESIQKKVPAIRILEAYFKQEIKIIFSEQRGLYFATHEFAFAEVDQRERMNQRLKESIHILMLILTYGQETQAFKKFDKFNKEVVATHIIYFMDSLKTSSSILTMPENEIMKQVGLLKELII